MLAPYLDEIELLLFESASDSLPSNHEIKKLSLLSNEFDLTYNVHLPIDISLSALDPSKQHTAMETIIKIMELTALLSPSTYTLHLQYDETDFEKERIKRWQER
ncbi:sugar phosphate isomerase/epimerase, partial [Candidatus Calescamantes bacterium]|nr:sugar phosphate isomerase/epimerase [Candidatus Calescamantes bacterium]